MPGPAKRIARSLSKTFARIRSRGSSDVARLVVDRIREAISSEESLVMFVRNTAGEPAAGAGDRALEFREATDADGPHYARVIGTDSPRTFARRLTADTRCFIVLLDDTLVHASWTTTRAAWTREIRAYLCPPSGDAYVYESFTSPSARGRGVYPFALRHIAATFERQGFARLWVAVEAHNAGSRRAVVKAGFEPAFEISYRRRLGRLTVEEPTGHLAHIGRGFICKQLP